MFAQKEKGRFFSRLLYLSIFIAFIAEVKGDDSWSASWSWPEKRQRYYMTDEDVIELLYSRASRSTPDHPNLLDRLKFRKEINSVQDLEAAKEAVERYSTLTNGRSSQTSMFFQRIYH